MNGKQYYVTRPDQTQEGPYDEQSLLTRYQAGKYPQGTVVWCEGMSDWASIDSICAPLPAAPTGYAQPNNDYATYLNSVNNPLKALQYACTHITFKGRAGRMEYWMFQLAVIVFFIALVVIGVMIEEVGSPDAASVFSSDGLSVAFVIFCLVVGLPVGWPLTVRRLHDIGLSGWLLLIGIIPFGDIILLILTCLDSNRGTNRYGRSLKYPNR